MSATDPGWYRDPSDALRHRYWDGEQWHTECDRLRRQGYAGPCSEDEE